MRLSVKCLVKGTVFLALLLVGGYSFKSLAQGEESSPIEIELIVPPQAGPGETIDVLIKYDAVDINAGADINYNFSGPGRIWTRDPEPPNPIVNTWKPTWDNTKGTIKIQFFLDEGTDGQTIRHVVEVRWGPKHCKFEATTQIKYVPPTATPTFTPRPQPKPTQAPPTATPIPAQPTITLTNAGFVNLEGQAIDTAKVNQEIVLAITYTSSGTLESVALTVRFEPDVVNIDGAQRTDEGYVFFLSSLPAALDGASVFETPLLGHIRPYADGGEQYELQASVRLEPAEGTTTDVLGEIIAAPIEVSQPTLLKIQATVETEIVKVGGSFIVHAICENPGPTSVKWLHLKVTGLSEEFAINPDKQTIDLIAANGGSQERLFTIHAPNDYEGFVTLEVVGTLGQEKIKSEPVTIELVPPTQLSLDAVISQSTVRAGQVFYVNVICTNNGRFVAEGVTAKLIDTTGNLGVLFQDLGDIDPGESRKAVFVVEVPRDFPANVVISLAVQAVSSDGTLNQSEALPITVVCVPVLKVAAQPPPGRVRGGQSVEVIVTLNNASQCVSKDISVSLLNLPDRFVNPPAQNVVELAPGAVRHLTFNVLIPEGYQGEAAFQVHASDFAGNKVESPQATIRVGGVSVTFTVVFGFLVVVAVMAIIVGTVFYFRNR